MKVRAGNWCSYSPDYKKQLIFVAFLESHFRMKYLLPQKQKTHAAT